MTDSSRKSDRAERLARITDWRGRRIVDEFGLSTQWTLLESAADRENRYEKLRAVMARLFAVAGRSFYSEKELQTEWAKIAAKKPGAPEGIRRREVDMELLEIYDHVVRLGLAPPEITLEKLPLDLARRAIRQDPDKYIPYYNRDPAKVARRLRLLLQQRQAEAAQPSRDLPDGTGNAVRTLLGSCSE